MMLLLGICLSLIVLYLVVGISIVIRLICMEGLQAIHDSFQNEPPGFMWVAFAFCIFFWPAILDDEE